MSAERVLTPAKVKRDAHRLAAKARKAGTLVPPAACEGCGAAKRLLAHHEDYSKPLQVDWLCPVCHAQRHVGDGDLRAGHRDPTEAARTIYWPDRSWGALKARAKELGLSVSAYLRSVAEAELRNAEASRTDG